MYKSGDWLAICDQCSRRAFASELIKRWDGRMVHSADHFGCNESRHPQDFVKALPDNHKLPFIRPDSDGVDLDLTTDPNLDDAPHTQIPAGTFGDYGP